MRIWTTLCLLCITIITKAQDISLIPKPVFVQESPGSFVITPSTSIIYEEVAGDLSASSTFFTSYLKSQYGYWGKKEKVLPPSASNTISLGINEATNPEKGGYTLKISQEGIDITGHDGPGVFAAIQTLIQLLPTPNPKLKTQNLFVPHVVIKDYPRFAYRGMHLDCGRHFWTVDFVKKYIDYLAMHKFNTFHWHLTEDQGWRIEIKKYPKLTSVGGWRNGTIIGRYPGTGNDGIKYGGYYTQEQVKDIVKYAADRFITVIPEIEMPGHSSAAIAAYPELSCFPNEPTIKYFPKQCKWNGDSSGKQVQQAWGVFDDVFCAGEENTFRFIQDVMDEVLALFPSTYIHIGGDECPKENWKRCNRCQQRIKGLKLKDEHELQSYFIQRVEKYLNSKGRILIGWDEILEGGLAPNAVVMSWRGEQGGIDAAKQNHDVIMTPGNPVYFDHSQSENEDSVTIGGYNPIEKVYAYEPVPKELNAEQAKHVLGAQANMWTEYMKNIPKVEYMLFPRISALSEALWSQKENKNWDDFQKRLMTQFKRYELWKVNYSKAFFDLKSSILPTQNFSGIKWKLESRTFTDDILIYKWNNKSEADRNIVSNKKECTRTIQSGGLYYGSSQSNKVVNNLIKQEFHFNLATGKKITPLTPISEKYPGDGAFTLVNGVQNEKGFARSKEFIAYEGKDCEVVIDLGKDESFASATIHTLRRESSWIYPPSSFEVFTSADGSNYTSAGATSGFTETNSATGNGVMQLNFSNDYNVRYIKIVAKNFGNIPAGKPGAGHKAWLFLDEIEVN